MVKIQASFLSLIFRYKVSLMKNIYVTLLVILCIAPLVFISCKKTDSHNSPSYFKVIFYDTDGKELFGEELKSKVSVTYRQNLKMKIVVPSDATKNIERPFFSYFKESKIINNTRLPLDYESKLEEFRCILTLGNQEIYNELLRLHYTDDKYFPYVTEALTKNTEGNWIPYKTKRIEVIENEKHTGIFFDFCSFLEKK